MITPYRGDANEQTVAFRDWAAERSNFAAEVAEMALARSVGDKVEQAYRRGDLFEKRRQLAEAWAAFCATPPPIGLTPEGTVPHHGSAASTVSASEGARSDR